MAILAVVAIGPVSNAAALKRIDLGASTITKEPNCGRDFTRDCTAEGHITAYQSTGKGMADRSFVVPFKGKIVSWSISLSKPTNKKITESNDPTNPHDAQLPFFNGLFGTPASARIAVLKRVQENEKGPPRYKMVRQSPTQILNSYFGTTVRFALAKPLNVIRGQVVALTLPTWAPAYWVPQACNIISIEGDKLDPNGCAAAAEKYSWRGSRAPDKCVLGTSGKGLDNLNKSRPQQKVGSVKRYGCYYAPGRLLYTATVVGKG